jgi:hypothetical protein
MKVQRLLTAATLTVMTTVSSGLLAPDVEARGYGRYDHHQFPAYPARPSRHYRPGRWGHPRPYYGSPYITDRAFKYLGITAVALGFLDLLDANQQRQHEAALIAAANRPGEVIVWESGGAIGSVQTTRSGTSTSGLQCREFQQTVTVGGRKEEAYGTACLQPDGDWQIVETR